MTVLLLKLHASHSVVARIVLARMVDLNKQKSLFFMELFLYLIFLDLDKIDVYRDKTSYPKFFGENLAEHCGNENANQKGEGN